MTGPDWRLKVPLPYHFIYDKTNVYPSLGDIDRRKGNRSMDEYEPDENEHMTPEEMQRFLDLEAKDGTDELDAYRRLMQVLDITWHGLNA